MEILIQEKIKPDNKQNLNLKFKKIEFSRLNIISVENQAGNLFYKKFCIICLTEFTAQRKDTLTCCPACSRNFRHCINTGQPLPMDIYKHKAKLK